MYHHAVNHPHTHIILSRLRIPLVLKCAAKILKIGIQIKIEHPKLFLNRGFCMEKLLAREVTIFLEKIKSSKILLKIHRNPHQIVRKAYQGSKHLNKVDKFARIKS